MKKGEAIQWREIVMKRIDEYVQRERKIKGIFYGRAQEKKKEGLRKS